MEVTGKNKYMDFNYAFIRCLNASQALKQGKIKLLQNNITPLGQLYMNMQSQEGD